MRRILRAGAAVCVVLLPGLLAIVACQGTEPKAGAESPGTGSAGSGSEAARALTTCPHTSPTTVPIALVVTAPGVITAPAYPGLCPGDTAVWTIENKCPSCGRVKVKIDKRVRRHPTTCASSTTMSENEDCFKKNQGADCNPENARVDPNTGPQPLGLCEIKPGAFNGCYKYNLKGTYDIDPEVEVQGGVGIDKGSPSPAVSPSP